jgi:hypothetical protein
LRTKERSRLKIILLRLAIRAPLAKDRDLLRSLKPLDRIDGYRFLAKLKVKPIPFCRGFPKNATSGNRIPRLSVDF